MKTIWLPALVGWCGLVHAQFAFEPVHGDNGVEHFYYNTNLMGGGAAFFDFDGDLDLDLWISGGIGRDGLFENIGGGAFVDISEASGLGHTFLYTTNSVITGDVDNDGDRDVFLTTPPGYPNHLIRNNGDGSFTDMTAQAGLLGDTAWSTSASFGDYNLDGNLDLYVGNWLAEARFLIDSVTGFPNGFAHTCAPNWLYLGLGDGRFVDVSETVTQPDTGCVLATTWSDFDRDDDVDMLIANDFGEWALPNTILRNRYPTNKLEPRYDSGIGMYGMGIAIGDPDHDGDLDYYMTNIGRNRLYVNNGQGKLLDKTAEAGVEDIYVNDSSSLYNRRLGRCFRGPRQRHLGRPAGGERVDSGGQLHRERSDESESRLPEQRGQHVHRHRG